MGQNTFKWSVERTVLLLKYTTELLLPPPAQSPYHVHSDLAHYCLAMLLSEGLDSGLLLRYQVSQHIFQILKSKVEKVRFPTKQMPEDCSLVCSNCQSTIHLKRLKWELSWHSEWNSHIYHWHPTLECCLRTGYSTDAPEKAAGYSPSALAPATHGRAGQNVWLLAHPGPAPAFAADWRINQPRQIHLSLPSLPACLSNKSTKINKLINKNKKFWYTSINWVNYFLT